MRTSVTFDWAGAVRDTPREATTSTTRRARRPTLCRMQASRLAAWVTGVSGSLSYQTGDPAGREAPRREIGELRDREIGARHDHGDVAGLLHDRQWARRLGHPGRPLARRRAQPPRL